MTFFRVLVAGLIALPVVVILYATYRLESERRRYEREAAAGKSEELVRINYAAGYLKRALKQRDAVENAKRRNSLPRRSRS